MLGPIFCYGASWKHFTKHLKTSAFMFSDVLSVSLRNRPKIEQRIYATFDFSVLFSSDFSFAVVDIVRQFCAFY